MPLLELEKAGLKAVVNEEIEKAIDLAKRKAHYLDRLEKTSDHYRTHKLSHRHLEGIVEGMVCIKELMEKYL